MRGQSLLPVSCLFAVGLFAVSCDRFDQEQQLHAIAALRLTDRMVEIKSAIIVNEISNQVGLIAYADSTVEATNSCSVALRSMYSAIWVNTNWENWAARVPDGRPVIVGKYEINGKPYYAGRSLSATVGPIKYEAAPGAGF